MHGRIRLNEKEIFSCMNAAFFCMFSRSQGSPCHCSNDSNSGRAVVRYKRIDWYCPRNLLTPERSDGEKQLILFSNLKVSNRQQYRVRFVSLSSLNTKRLLLFPL